MDEEEKHNKESQPAVFIDLTTDFGFKRIFERKEFMIPFLNDLLSTYNKKGVITDITYLNTENLGEVSKDKRIVFDLKCKTQDGDIILVEMQKRDQEYFDDRVIYYMNRNVAMQGELGDDLWKFGIKKVYGVFLMDFNEKRQLDNKAVRHCGLYDYTNQCAFSDKQEFWLVNLPQFRRYTKKDCKTNLDKWLYIISNIKNMETMPFTMEMPVFKGLKTAAEIASMTRNERESYILEYDAYRTSLAAWDYAIKEGRAKGLQEGRAEGLQEGRAEGEHNANLATARKMLSKGFSVDSIADITGLSPSEIASL